MRLDLHAHTIYSADGNVEPEIYIKHAQKIGLAGLAITDHNEVKGAIKAYQLAKKNKDVTIVRGVEVSTSNGHVLAYGVKDKIPRGLTPEETKERIVELGGVAVAAHPYRLVSGLGVETVKQAKFDLVEVLNHRSPKHENGRALKLANELGAGLLGGSDAHYTWELGLAATEFKIETDNEGDIIAEISKKRTEPIGESSTFFQGVAMYSKLVVHWLKRGFKRI